MECENPILCYDDGRTKKFRHYDLATPIFKTIHNKRFNCGTCIACRKKRSQELAMKCVLQASLQPQNCFITLTYDEKKPGYHNRFQYKDIQDFKKRLRRHCEYHYKKKIKVFNVHEYGKNGKKHWHLVVFNHDFEDKTLHTVKDSNSLYTSKTLEDLWPHGFNTIGNVTEASAMYQAQYTQKDFKYGNRREKSAHSIHSGIGRDYFYQHYKQILSLGYIPFNGRKFPIPRYFCKLAHKHFSHYYQIQNFYDTPQRKKLYSPFKQESDANKEIADLFLKYYKEREIKLEILSEDWKASIQEYLFSSKKTPFQKTADNFRHDLKNKNSDYEF